MISYFNSHKKKIASSLILVFLLNLSTPLISYAKPVVGGNNPVADELAKYVDPFTGDFNYSVPLMNISGPNGENFPVSANYSGGIKMNQEASWIGLGWDFNPGEISRNVNGYPDDWNGSYTAINKRSNSNNETKTFKVYGPIHYKDFDYTDPLSTMDTYESTRLLMNSKPFEFPDYDDYNVTGFGTMRPHMFEYATLVNTNIINNSIGKRFSNEQILCDSARIINYEHYRKFEKSPDFRFDNELSEFSTPKYLKPETGQNPINYKHDFYKPKEVDQSTGNDKYYKANGEVLSYNVANKGKQVFYFTNQKINQEFEFLKSNSNFLEYKKVETNETPRPSNLFPEHGIGAFQVVDLDGTTYHYSLPVYTKYNNQYNFIFKNEEVSSTFNPFKDIDPNEEFNIISKNDKYAVSWKLTAITGPDFEDINNDGVANNGDKGYWIKFDYGLWADYFSWREPYFGNFSSSIQNKYLPSNISNFYFNKNSNSANNLFREGSFSTGNTQQYYLNSIETSTQKAIFVKDVRFDSHSISISGQKIPKLKLAKIILFNKNDISNLTFENSGDTQLGGESNLFHASNIIDVFDFEILRISNSLDEKVIRHIDFTYDHSLCKGVYNNSKNTINCTYISASIAGGYYYVNSVNNNGILSNESGKLTLLEISSKEQKNIQINPSFKFDYEQNNVVKNPNYNPDQQDYWGYYKSDYNSIYRGHYTTFESAKNVDAWSLKKITTPLGAEIAVNYESDKYSSVGYDENEDLINPFNLNFVSKNYIQRTFQIYSVHNVDNNRAKAMFLDNDVFNFVFNTNEDKVSKTIVRLPLGITEYAPYRFNCDNVNAFDDPGYNFKYPSDVSPVNGNYLSINKNNTCQGNLDFTNLIYRRAGFLTQYLKSSYGGGVRVKNISIKDVVQDIPYYLNFVYNNGVATSEPDNFASMNDIDYILSSNTVGTDRHIPTSNVGYTSVDIINTGIYSSTTDMNVDEYIGKTSIEYNNYTKNISPDEKESTKLISQTTHPTELQYQEKCIRTKIRVEDYFNNEYGKVKRRITFDKNNNAIDLYIYDYVNIPTTREVFYKSYTHGITDENLRMRITKFVRKSCEKVSYRNVLKDVIHYKNGAIVEEVLTKPENYNLITGQCEQVLSKDISGRVTQTIITPAYKINVGSNMEPKCFANSTNKNLLNAPGKVVVNNLQNATLTEAVDATNTSINSASISNWTNIASVRKYNVNTQEFYTENNVIVPFYVKNSKTYNGKTNESLWDLNSQVTLFDENNKILEVKGISDKKNSIKYNSYGNGILAECKNASYASFTFNSFEEQMLLSSNNYQAGGEVKIGNGEYRMEQSTIIMAHSGNFVSVIPSNQQYGANFKSNVNSTDGLTSNRTYVAKVWVHENSDPSARLFINLSGKINGNAYTDYKEVRKDNSSNLQIGQWILMSVQIVVPNNFSTTNSNEFINVGLAKNANGNVSYFDDLIFSPIDAIVTGYVINPFTKQTDVIIGNDGLSVRIEYDAAGRNTFTSKETSSGIKIISRNKYNFGR